MRAPYAALQVPLAARSRGVLPPPLSALLPPPSGPSSTSAGSTLVTPALSRASQVAALRSSCARAAVDACDGAQHGGSCGSLARPPENAHQVRLSPAGATANAREAPRTWLQACAPLRQQASPAQTCPGAAHVRMPPAGPAPPPPRARGPAARPAGPPPPPPPPPPRARRRHGAWPNPPWGRCSSAGQSRGGPPGTGTPPATWAGWRWCGHSGG